MKKITFLLIAFAIVIISCNKQKETFVDETSNPNLLTLEEISNLAIEHNNALNSVLIGLKEREVSYAKNKENIEFILNEELEKFYQDNISDASEQNDAILQSKKEVSRFIKKGRSQKLSRSAALSSIEEVIEEYSSNLTEGQIKYLKELDLVFKTSGNDVDLIITELNRIMYSVRQELSAEEAQIILAGTEIGKASIQYWSENIDEWKKLLGEGGSPQTRWFSWSELAGSDVAGAVGGATTAAVVNLLPGAGQVAYGSVILGGAAGTSATDAVMQVWNHYF